MRIHKLSIGLAAGAFLAACTNDPTPITNPPPTPPPPPAMATFEVTVSNLTNAQPLSPVAVIAHGDGYNVFTVGEAATAGLEVQAEGGDPADLIAEADADANVSRNRIWRRHHSTGRTGDDPVPGPHDGTRRPARQHEHDARQHQRRHHRAQRF